jgi:hypothetical protein
MNIRETLDKKLSSLDDSALAYILHYVEELDSHSSNTMLERLGHSGFVKLPTRTANDIATIEPLLPSVPSLSETLVEHRR